MRIELLPGMTNVVRFPVERRARPTLGLLRDIAPDVREVMSLAEAFGMEMPAPDLRGRTDAATAEHIATNAPVAPAELEAFLAELEGIAVRRAILPAGMHTTHRWRLLTLRRYCLMPGRPDRSGPNRCRRKRKPGLIVRRFCCWRPMRRPSRRRVSRVPWRWRGIASRGRLVTAWPRWTFSWPCIAPRADMRSARGARGVLRARS